MKELKFELIILKRLQKITKYDLDQGWTTGGLRPAGG